MVRSDLKSIIVKAAKANDVSTASVLELSKALEENGGDAENTAMIFSGFNQKVETAALGSAKAGTYGSLTLNADGSYAYSVDNSNAAVQELRTSSNTLTDTFMYTMRDAFWLTSSSTLTVTMSPTTAMMATDRKSVV